MSSRRVVLVLLGLITVVVIAIALGGLLYWAMRQPVSIAEGTVLEVPISGSVSEVKSGSPILQVFQPAGQNLFDLREALDYAARDSRIKGLYLEVQPLSMSFAEIEEVREMLKQFRASRKPVRAYLAVDVAGEGEMYLASAADSITINPGTGLLVNGLLAQVTFYKGTLDKIHVKPEFIEFKEYKNPGTYTREKMTPEYRGMLESVIRDLEQRFVTTVAQDRKISAERLRQLMSEGIITDEAAVKEKLVDNLGYKHNVRDSMKFLAKAKRSEYKGIGLDRYLDAARDRFAATSANKVAFVAAEGVITSGTSAEFADVIGGNSFATALRKLREDKSIKGVILRVNSPGGSVVGSEMVWEEVRMLEKERKPVVVSMSGVAASGGYYIAMNADRIVCQPSTITGSVGVIFGKFDLSGLYEWLGMDVEQVKLSPNADIFSLSNSMSPEQRARVEKWMGDVYNRFVSKVAEARKMSFEQMEPKARGRIYTGTQAKAAGLIDEVGGIDKAVEQMRTALRLDKNERIQLVIYPRPKTLWESLTSGDLLPVKMPPLGLKDWLESEAGSLSTPAPWIMSREVVFR